MFKHHLFKRIFGGVILPISALLSLPSCVQSQPQDVKMAYDIMHQHADYMKRTHQAKLFGIGGGFPDKITSLNMSFRVCGPMGIDEARVLMVSSTQHLLKLVNENERIRPYLDNYPFTSENLEYSFFVVDKNNINIQQEGNLRDPDNLSYVSNRNKKITYSIVNSERDIFQHIHEESYANARKIVLNP